MSFDFIDDGESSLVVSFLGAYRSFYIIKGKNTLGNRYHTPSGVPCQDPGPAELYTTLRSMTFRSSICAF